MQIAIALVTLALCGGFLWWFRRSENRRSFKRSEEESAERERKAQETAQEFVDARDLGENCLYTNDGYIFAYLKVDGMCLELLSRQEQKALCRQVSAAFSLVRRPYKFSGVSRPADISKSLQKYSELAEQAVGGRKKLLLSDARYLANMVVSGETTERVYYIAIWDSIQKADERSITSAAQDIAKKLSECGIGAELIDRSGIVRLCNLVNNPAYVHIESTNIDEAIALLAV